MLMVDDDLTAV